MVDGRNRPLPGNRVGGGREAPVLPHHRTYSAYPAVSSTVSTGATTRQGSFPFRHRGRWLLLAHPSSGSAFTRDAGAHGLLPPFSPAARWCSRCPATARCGAGTFSGAPGELPDRRPDQALRERPVGLVRSLLQIRQALGPGDVDVEVLDVDVDLVRRRGQRIRSPDCPG